MVIQQDDAKKPLPRYEQGAALMGPNLYVMGGHYSKWLRGAGGGERVGGIIVHSCILHPSLKPSGFGFCEVGVASNPTHCETRPQTRPGTAHTCVRMLLPQVGATWQTSGCTT